MTLGENVACAEMPVTVVNADGASSFVLVCEHASNIIPERYLALGIAEEVRQSHVAWDPGAMGVAEALSTRLDARLVAGGISRLVYDCNRPPEAVDAIPERSEVFDIPGNIALDRRAREARVDAVYYPFQAALADVLARVEMPVLVTIHSFTPVYEGFARPTKIGVLHDADTRFADAMLKTGHDHTELDVARNQPYGPEDGVTHTLKAHALGPGWLNVMLEVRNDLIASEAAQIRMAEMLADWLEAARQVAS